MKLLKKMEKFKLAEPLFEAARVVLSYRGEKYSPAYIQGISGGAFRVGGICPCAPTCTYAMRPPDLPKALGYEVEQTEFLDESGVDMDRWKDMVEKIKSEIDNDRPALMWSQFSYAEWDVVNGYDDKKQVFIGCNTNHEKDAFVRAPYNKASKLDIPMFGAIIIGDKTSEPDLRELEISSLKEAVKHARTVTEIDPDPEKWTFLNGIQAYRRWEDSFKDNPDRKKDIGDSYCFRVYYNTHMAAHDYLMEIAPKYKAAEEELKKAAECFKEEIDAFKGAWKTVGFSAPKDISEEGMVNAYKTIGKACDHYSEGIDWIDKALKLI